MALITDDNDNLVPVGPRRSREATSLGCSQDHNIPSSHLIGSGGPMRFQTAYAWMKHGKKMRVPGFKGYWMWDDVEQTIVIVTKLGDKLDIRGTQDVDFTFSFVNSDEWEFYEGHDDPRENTDISVLD